MKDFVIAKLYLGVTGLRDKAVEPRIFLQFDSIIRLHCLDL